VPVAAREFSRSEYLVIRVPVYAPDRTPDVTATLMNVTGQAMRPLTVQPPNGGTRAEIDVPLAGLAPSDYAVSIIATSPAGQAKDTLKFRITN
jgi:hypothetical protein